MNKQFLTVNFVSEEVLQRTWVRCIAEELCLVHVQTDTDDAILYALLVQCVLNEYAADLRLVGKYAYNAPKVLDSSHTILFCTQADITTEHLDQLLQQDELSGRFKDETAKQNQKDARTGYVEYYRNEKGDIQRWAENQTFIALGQMLLAAGIEHVDATPEIPLSACFMSSPTFTPEAANWPAAFAAESRPYAVSSTA